MRENRAHEAAERARHATPASGSLALKATDERPCHVRGRETLPVVRAYLVTDNGRRPAGGWAACNAPPHPTPEDSGRGWPRIRVRHRIP
ncbi:hypothetical protein ACF1AO_30005 [Streptomyces longwoodensis]|uniref:hypothetical protein n=1 Tax=Streptomyces longwoodensis TaxID=68231 RepID=UPI0036FCF2B4